MKPESRPVFGIIIMAVSMMLFPVTDGIAKLLSDRYPILLLNWERFAVAAVIFVPLALPHFKKHRLERTQISDLLMRSLLNVGAISLFFLAIARVPMADALGAYFVAPIIAAVLATLLLGEPFRRIQGVSVFLGFVGALLVVRPSFSTDVGMLYALGSGVLFAFFLILTRKNANDVPVMVTLGVQCIVGLVVLSPVAFYFWTPQDRFDFILVGAAGLLWSGAHLAAVLAFKYAGAATLSPIVYFEIFGGVCVGYLLFGDIPGELTILGIVIIILAGFLVQRGAGGEATADGSPGQAGQDE